MNKCSQARDEAEYHVSSLEAGDCHVEDPIRSPVLDVYVIAAAWN